MTDTAHPAEQASLRADELEDANDIEGALQAMTEAIRLDPENPKYWALRGRLFYVQKKWHMAIRDFDKSIAMKPHSSTTIYFRARARGMLDDLDGAIEDFERCIALEPNAADAYEQLGSIHYYRGELQPALAAYRKAIEIDPASLTGLAELHIPEIEQKLRAHQSDHPKPTADPKSG
jgi:tetratricopeptide (TPR) repeat protein